MSSPGDAANLWVRWADEFLHLLEIERDALRRTDGEELARASRAKAEALRQRPDRPLPEHGRRELALRLSQCDQLNRANGALLHLRAQRIRARLGLDLSGPPAYGRAGSYLGGAPVAGLHAKA